MPWAPDPSASPADATQVRERGRESLTEWRSTVGARGQGGRVSWPGACDEFGGRSPSGNLRAHTGHAVLVPSLADRVTHVSAPPLKWTDPVVAVRPVDVPRVSVERRLQPQALATA